MSLETTIRYGRLEGIRHMQIDIEPVFENAEAFAEASEYMCRMFENESFDGIICVDSTGTVFASQVAARMGKPFITVGSRNSMLRDMVSEKIETHHGDTYFRIPAGTVKEGQKIAVIGDMLSHGKDVRAAVELVESQGGTVVKIGMFAENSDFGAREKLLKGIPLESRIVSGNL